MSTDGDPMKGLSRKERLAKLDDVIQGLKKHEVLSGLTQARFKIHVHHATHPKDTVHLSGRDEVVKSKLAACAKASCRYCYGRGYEGVGDDKVLEICRCVLKNGRLASEKTPPSRPDSAAGAKVGGQSERAGGVPKQGFKIVPPKITPPRAVTSASSLASRLTSGRSEPSKKG